MSVLAPLVATTLVLASITGCHGNAADIAIYSTTEDDSGQLDVVEMPEISGLLPSPIALSPNPLVFMACEMGATSDREVLIRNSTGEVVTVTRVSSVGYGFYLKEDTPLPMQIEPMNTTTVISL